MRDSAPHLSVDSSQVSPSPAPGARAPFASAYALCDQKQHDALRAYIESGTEDLTNRYVRRLKADRPLEECFKSPGETAWDNPAVKDRRPLGLGDLTVSVIIWDDAGDWMEFFRHNWKNTSRYMPANRNKRPKYLVFNFYHEAGRFLALPSTKGVHFEFLKSDSFMPSRLLNQTMEDVT